MGDLQYSSYEEIMGTLKCVTWAGYGIFIAGGVSKQLNDQGLD